MDRNLLDQSSSLVNDSNPRSVTAEPAERAEVLRARRVTENDWRVTLEGTRALAERLEAVVQAAPDAALGSCRTVGRPGHQQVQVEIGCRGPHLLAGLLEAVIDDHAATHPQVSLQAVMQVDDSMRPDRIDVLVPSAVRPQRRVPTGMLGL